MKYVILIMVLVVGACSGDKAESTPKDAQTVVSSEIVYEADSVSLKGYLAMPANLTEKAPGVLVVHEWWGQNEYARKRADMLAEMGYIAFALDMYGEGKTATHPEDAQKFASAVMQNIAAGEARFDAALNTLKSNASVDQGKIAAIGYCFGGGVVLHMARKGKDLAAVASFHGSLGSMFTPAKGGVKAEILVANGADDPMVTAEQIEAFKKEMDAAEATYQIRNYPGAKHSFTNPGADSVGIKYNLPLAYNKEADEKSWQAMQELLTRAFAK
jgi:dienelactone hydrolase